jgi:hypothetical protein
MTGMDLWAALITGVVGVAGIAGTILAAQMTARNQTANLVLSINEQRSNVRLGDKRQVYANFMAALHQFEAMRTEAMMSTYYAKTGSDKLSGDVLDTAIFDRLSELELVGSELVITQAQALKSRVMNFFDDLPLDDNGAVDLTAVESWDEQTDRLETELQKTMRAELERQGG